ncbi:kinase-like domain-containing protein [Mycena pura]|uniref:Kinase-like domain-containing protein n=1 Tax=Mycena pura TaxID=153505 RepID=A0AAD6YH34_9AGAR|nr:kinase-like domain-containing protein [Mycena pura]
MSTCNGCSDDFPWMQSERCGLCYNRDTGQNTDWPQCAGCGRVFQYLGGAQCVSCSKRGTNLTNITNAVDNPPNPRSRDIFIPPAQPSLTNNPANTARAQQVLASVAGSYANAMVVTGGSMHLPKNKVRGTTRAEPTIQIKISKIVLLTIDGAAVPKAKQAIDYDNTLHMVRESSPVEEVIHRIFIVVQHVVLENTQHLLQKNEVALYYTASDTIIPDHLLTGSILELWAGSAGVTLKSKDRQMRVLPITLKLRIRRQDDDENQNPYFSALTTTTARKRKARAPADDDADDDDAEPHPKRTTLQRAGPGAYRTSIAPHRAPSPVFEELLVQRISANLVTIEGDDGQTSVELQFTEASDTETIRIFQATEQGKTKSMSVIELDGTRFAAKELFDIGAGKKPTYRESVSFLKREVNNQLVAARCLEGFQEAASQNNTPIADVRVAKPFLLEATADRRVFLVDFLLSNTQTIKYSGTEQAGANNDFYGKTCDAFAHFSLWDSGEAFVLADIQGIKEPVYVEDARAPDTLVLFDLMAHTADVDEEDRALGDAGSDGIAQFRGQHVCNSICRCLHLPSTRPKPKPKNRIAIAALITNDDGSDGSNGD